MSTTAIAANHPDATVLLPTGGNLNLPFADAGSDFGGNRLTSNSALWTIETQWATSASVGQQAEPIAFGSDGIVPIFDRTAFALAALPLGATGGMEEAIDPADELLLGRLDRLRSTICLTAAAMPES